MTITVIGAGGYIGKRLVGHLQRTGVEHWAVPRDNAGLLARPLGHVIFAAGVTGDFAKRPFETVDAHVGLLRDVLARADFDSLLYLSSTRVYMGASQTVESAAVRVDPNNPDHLYNLTKLLGENLCRYSLRPARVVRLSNVFGFDDATETFLPIIIRQALELGRIELESALDSAKDYISLDAVPGFLLQIAQSGRESVYNLAAGENTSHRSIVERISAITGCSIKVRQGAPTIIFAPIDIGRLEQEFGVPQHGLLEQIPELVAAYRRRR